MNGADRLCDTLLTNAVDVCFANPGTSEMHFVAALDRKPQMRCVLGLFEGVVTGAADGYARMADKPAATLLHCGPGMANALANMHNARRARTPMINVVGDHATYHLKHDAPLTSDIESLARPMSQFVRRIASAEDVGPAIEEAYVAALTAPGVATVILPADCAWNSVEPAALKPVRVPTLKGVDSATLRAAAAGLRKHGRRAAIMLTGLALRQKPMETAARICAATGARIFSQTSNGRTERGAGRVAMPRVFYPVDKALDQLKDVDYLVLVGAQAPVGFFAYPGKPGRMTHDGCEIVTLAGPGDDLPAAIGALAEEIGATKTAPAFIAPPRQEKPALPTGPLDGDKVCAIVAALLPENCIVCEESGSSARGFYQDCHSAPQHDHIQLTGGAIGEGIPLAIGAAVACPGRKVIGMQADGSGMYTVQGLWTQAREKLDIVTVVLANRTYQILHGEMRNVGVNDFGRNATLMLNIDEPVLDWVMMARGMGVEAARATTAEEFVSLFKAALARKGPFLIEAAI
ncbi:acetolactate synthase large subunit [Bosea sp. (in: a-proteobacteria)]|uniref:acetolactate synthase large subunit n=1 Tax=Bosea sp. (in: a-proteobacteria) TaxID=1871050 RepID=UPI00261EA350|nr:acetolactate synthase large subunit [Bosea sp. (in: a-proteobacteria)]MCO5089414.1 acetolactate synthase large subunit [Bosea sp. (in: a-proteobacteria)]